MKLKDPMTVGEVINLVEKALTLEGAEQKELVDALLATGPHARTNIGYLSGYFSREKADRILALFAAEHPIFGKSPPTPEEAFATGQAFGKKPLTGDDHMNSRLEDYKKRSPLELAGMLIELEDARDRDRDRDRKKLADLKAEVKFLKDRERDICATVGDVSDGGQYRNDIIEHLTLLNIRAERANELEQGFMRVIAPVLSAADALSKATPDKVLRNVLERTVKEGWSAPAGLGFKKPSSGTR